MINTLVDIQNSYCNYLSDNSGCEAVARSASFASLVSTDLIADVTLVHPRDSRHQVKGCFLADTEAKKTRRYEEAHHGRPIFLPLWHANHRSAK
jgi:hypothetical protein